MWWLYDVTAVVVLLVCVYFSGRHGVFKGGICAVCCVVGLVAGLTVSSSVADSLYKTTVRDGTVNKLDKTIVEYDISADLVTGLETMGYSVVVRKEKIDDILLSEKNEDTDVQIYKYMNNINGKKIDDEENFYKNLRKCYASVLTKLIKDDVSLYATATAEQRIIDGKADFGNLARTIRNSDTRTDASRIIADDFIADAYKNVIRLVFIAVFVTVLFVVGILTGRAMAGNRSPMDESNVSHITGGLCGLITGVAMVCVVSALFGLYAITGNNSEVFFENPDIDKSFIFGFAYNLIMNR